MQQTGDFFGASTKVLTVAELTRNIRSLLEARVGSVWVQGEVSNYKEHSSGHRYFTLKDQRAAVACVIFRTAMVTLRQPLADGAQVQVYGNLTVFEARGVYQLSVEVVQPRGLGLLQAKFEALKRKLEAEGLFDPARKKPLPKFPQRVGIVTSPSGAAIRDILNVLQRRAPGLKVLINPVRVQGTGAAAEIAAAIHELARAGDDVSSVEQVKKLPYIDVIILARGGGSMEDLWEFNEEIVARAIAASNVPIVSAVGHEIDFTIADFVADLRAPTPSAAAELIVADAGELTRRLGEIHNGFARCLRKYLQEMNARLGRVSADALKVELARRVRDGYQELDWVREVLRKNSVQAVASARQRLARVLATFRAFDPQRGLERRRVLLLHAQRRLTDLMPQNAMRRRERLARSEQLLRALAPEATLRRGYSITRTADGRVIRSTAGINKGQTLRTQLLDGALDSTVV